MHLHHMAISFPAIAITTATSHRRPPTALSHFSSPRASNATTHTRFLASSPFHARLASSPARIRLATSGPPGPSGPVGPSGGGGGGGGGGDGDEGEDGDDSNERNREEAMLMLAAVGRGLETLPADLAAAIKAGRIPGDIVRRFLDLEKSPIMRWLLQFGGFKERLLADDLFLTKVAIECGVGIFTKVNFVSKKMDLQSTTTIIFLVIVCLSLKIELIVSISPFGF